MNFVCFCSLIKWKCFHRIEFICAFDIDIAAYCRKNDFVEIFIASNDSVRIDEQWENSILVLWNCWNGVSTQNIFICCCHDNHQNVRLCISSENVLLWFVSRLFLRQYQYYIYKWLVFAYAWVRCTLSHTLTCLKPLFMFLYAQRITVRTPWTKSA